MAVDWSKIRVGDKLRFSEEYIERNLNKKGEKFNRKIVFTVTEIRNNTFYRENSIWYADTQFSLIGEYYDLITQKVDSITSLSVFLRSIK